MVASSHPHPLEIDSVYSATNIERTGAQRLNVRDQEVPSAGDNATKRDKRALANEPGSEVLVRIKREKEKPWARPQ